MWKTIDVDVDVDLADFSEVELIECLNDLGYEVFKKSAGGTDDDLAALADAKIHNSPNFERMFADYIYAKLGRIIP